MDDDAHAVARAAGEVARVDLALWKEGDAVAVAREDLLLRQGRGLLLWRAPSHGRGAQGNSGLTSESKAGSYASGADARSPA